MIHLLCANTKEKHVRSRSGTSVKHLESFELAHSLQALAYHSQAVYCTQAQHSMHHTTHRQCTAHKHSTARITPLTLSVSRLPHCEHLLSRWPASTPSASAGPQHHRPRQHSHPTTHQPSASTTEQERKHLLTHTHHSHTRTHTHTTSIHLI